MSKYTIRPHISMGYMVIWLDDHKLTTWAHHASLLDNHNKKAPISAGMEGWREKDCPSPTNWQVIGVPISRRF